MVYYIYLIYLGELQIFGRVSEISVIIMSFGKDNLGIFGLSGCFGLPLFIFFTWNFN